MDDKLVSRANKWSIDSRASDRKWVNQIEQEWGWRILSWRGYRSVRWKRRGNIVSLPFSSPLLFSSLRPRLYNRQMEKFIITSWYYNNNNNRPLSKSPMLTLLFFCAVSKTNTITNSYITMIFLHGSCFYINYRLLSVCIYIYRICSFLPRSFVASCLVHMHWFRGCRGETRVRFIESTNVIKRYFIRRSEWTEKFIIIAITDRFDLDRNS